MNVYSRRLADLKGVLLFVQHPLEAGDGFDLYCVQAAFGGETNRAAEKKSTAQRLVVPDIVNQGKN